LNKDEHGRQGITDGGKAGRSYRIERERWQSADPQVVQVAVPSFELPSSGWVLMWV